MRLGLRYFIESLGLTSTETEVFAEWAFGPEYKSYLGMKSFMWAWNSRHRDSFPLENEGTMTEDIPKMVAFWKGYTQW